MYDVVRGHRALALDDTSAVRIWACSALEVFANMLSAIAGDLMWKLHLGMAPAQLKSLAYAKDLQAPYLLACFRDVA